MNENELYITERQSQILELLSRGYTYSNIAEKLNISYITVRAHIAYAKERIDAATTYELVARYVEHKLNKPII